MKLELKITPWAMISTYAIANACLYSWVFWNGFNINILQFTSITDLIPSILYILAIPCIALFFGFAFIVIWRESKDSIIDYLNKKIPKLATRSDSIVEFTPPMALAFISAALLIYRFYTVRDINNEFQESIKGILIALAFMTISCILAIFVDAKTNFLIQLRSFRTVTIMLIFLTPVLSYVTAFSNVKNIVNGHRTYLISTDGQCSKNVSEQFRYISSVSDKAFSLSLMDGSICVFKYNNLRLIPETSKSYEVKVDTDRI